MVENILKTSADWFEEFKQNDKSRTNIVIYDNDGWRDGKCNFDKDLITKSDFTKRLLVSTLMWKNITKG